jgi:hypothetical protein
VQARSYFKRNSEQDCPYYASFTKCIQELFKIVPDSMRSALDWNGP